MRYTWTLDKGYLYPLIANFLRSQSNNTVTLPTSLLLAYATPHTYSFMLSVSNYLRLNSMTTSFSVEFVVEAIPRIFIEGAENRTVVRTTHVALCVICVCCVCVT
jgi:hypothetical protein